MSDSDLVQCEICGQFNVTPLIDVDVGVGVDLVVYGDQCICEECFFDSQNKGDESAI